MSLKRFKYGRVDGQNKVPTNIFKKNCLNKTYGMKLSATSMWTLVRIFPLIHGSNLKSHPHYLHFIMLIEIFRDLNGDSFDEAKINDIGNRIEKYLIELKRINQRDLTSKQNFMIHYGRAIRMYGPPKNSSTMRFES